MKIDFLLEFDAFELLEIKCVWDSFLYFDNVYFLLSEDKIVIYLSFVII